MIFKIKNTLHIFLMLILMAFSTPLQAQYIAEILEYKPAPGQFINTSCGVPDATKSLINSTKGNLSLGAFGGYVIFRFEKHVVNDENNPYGVDFTIFGNPLKSQLYDVETWSEQGIVSVMQDANNNGLPDETWYELAGSKYFFPATKKHYKVTYINPKKDFAVDVPWFDNLGNEGCLNINSYHSQPYYPMSPPFNFDAVNQERYSLQGSCIEEDMRVNDFGEIELQPQAFGYADNHSVNLNCLDYTLPDNPYTLEIENSGGDAFDISWAVDSAGNYVDLDSILFIKVHTAILADAGEFGEVSTEIRGAIDIPSMPNIGGVRDRIVIKRPPKYIAGGEYQIELAVFENGRYNPDAQIEWSFNLSENNVSIDANNLLVFSGINAMLEAEARLKNKPDISAKLTCKLISPTNIKGVDAEKVAVYPNPVGKNLFVRGVEIANVEIFDFAGKKIMQLTKYKLENPISIEHLPQGFYIIKVSASDFTKNLIFIKS